MKGLGDRLRSRAAELGLSSAEVARRAGLATTRYGHYVGDYREPDLATLVRICRVLGVRPDVLLAYDSSQEMPDELRAKRGRITAFAEAMDAGSLDLAILVMQAIAATPELRNSPLASAGNGAVDMKPRRRARTKAAAP